MILKIWDLESDVDWYHIFFKLYNSTFINKEKEARRKWIQKTLTYKKQIPVCDTTNEETTATTLKIEIYEVDCLYLDVIT